MGTKRISEFYGTDSLTRLRNLVFKLGFFVVILVLISSKGTSLFSIEENSWILTVINWTAVSFGLLLARQTFWLRRLDTKVKEFYTLIESKEQFVPIWIDLYNLKEDFGQMTKGTRDFEASLDTEFSLLELVDYISVWRKVASVFSKGLAREYTTPPMLLFPANFDSVRGMARLIGSQKFSELLIRKALQHNVIEELSEMQNDDTIEIRYKDLGYIKNK